MVIEELVLIVLRVLLDGLILFIFGNHIVKISSVLMILFIYVIHLAAVVLLP